MTKNFNFFLPATVEKAKDKTGSPVMQIAGIASTTAEDSDEEILLPGGFDLSYFLNSGFVNWHHRQKDKPAAVIGEPVTAEIIKNGKELKVLCQLYNTPLAKEVYELGEVLEKQSKTGRRLGFSIEGKVLERDKNNPKIVTKAAITGCAITYQPKNPNTLAEIVKAEGAGDSAQYEIDMDSLAEELGMLSNGGAEILKACGDNSDELIKVENAAEGEVVEQDKIEDEEEKDEEVEKDLNSASGAALAKESVAEELKDGRSADGAMSKADVEEYLLKAGISLQVIKTEQLINFTKEVMKKDTITQADLDKAMDFINKAAELEDDDTLLKGKEIEEEDDDDDEDEEEDGGKKEEKEDDGDEMTKSIFTDLEKAQNNLRTNYAKGFSSVAILIKGLTDELGSLRQEISELKSAPAAQRKALLRPGGSQPIEKSFDGDFGTGNQQQSNRQTLSISSDKPRIVTALENLAFAPGGLNDAIAKSMTTFESSSVLDNVGQQALKQAGFDLIA